MEAEIKQECIRLIQKSNFAIIYSYVNGSGRDPFDQYISSLEEKDKERVLALLVIFLRKGYISNKQKFKYLKGSERIFEFKSYQDRILSFYLQKKQPKSIVLTHGFKKKQGNTPKKQIEKSERIRKKLLSLDEEGKLRIMENE